MNMINYSGYIYIYTYQIVNKIYTTNLPIPKSLGFGFGSGIYLFHR